MQLEKKKPVPEHGLGLKIVGQIVERCDGLLETEQDEKSYRVTLALNIKNSLVGLSFVYAGLGVSMAVFLYHGFVKSIPMEMEEAAAIDGCGSLQTFFRIVLPMLKPITATICITNVLWVWNDFLLPLIIISDNKEYTLLLSTNTLFGQYSSDWTAILSALILAALPVIVFYAIFQKQILKGIADGAVKG